MRLLRPLVLAASAGAAAVVVGAQGAHAGIIFCNEFPRTVYIAIAYRHRHLRRRRQRY